MLTLIKYLAIQICGLFKKGQSLLLLPVMDRKFVYLIFSSTFFTTKKHMLHFCTDFQLLHPKWGKSTFDIEPNLFNLYRTVHAHSILHSTSQSKYVLYSLICPSALSAASTFPLDTHGLLFNWWLNLICTCALISYHWEQMIAPKISDNTLF